jgi:hypothetical protein
MIAFRNIYLLDHRKFDFLAKIEKPAACDLYMLCCCQFPQRAALTLLEFRGRPLAVIDGVQLDVLQNAVATFILYFCAAQPLITP